MSASERTDKDERSRVVRSTGLAMARASSLIDYVRSSSGIVQRRRPSIDRPKLLRRPLAIQAGLAVLAVLSIALAMAFLDTPAFALASRLPTWVVDWFYQITDFGRSGWILIPVGGLILFIALGAASSADDTARGVLRDACRPP